MRIAVMGAGGTGGYFGGLLARAGEDVTFIARGEHLAALRARGLTLSSRLVGDVIVPVQATDTPATVGPVDLILFCVKSYDTATAAEAMRPLVGPHTTVLPLQNGIDAADRLAPAIGRDHLVGGVAFITSAVASPGAIVQSGGPGKIVTGELPGGRSPRIDRIVQLLAHAGIPADANSDIQLAIWEKFMFICAFGGITALTRLPIGPILASPECCSLFEAAVQEVRALAVASDVCVPVDSVERALAVAAAFEPWARGSLAHDLASGRRLELDSLNGMVVRLARARDVSVPINAVIFAALRPYSEGPPIWMTGDSA